MHSPTKENWEALKRISLLYFKELRTRKPTLSIDDVVTELNLPKSGLIFELLRDACFRDKEAVTAEQACAVASMCLRGVWSQTVISQETGISTQKVDGILRSLKGGYGQLPYGKCSYGGSRKTSTNNQPVSRRVTIAGQLSYRGKTYTLGASYRGRNATVRERGEQLLVTFSDRSPLYLSKRH